jgi:hypothetical protein
MNEVTINTEMNVCVASVSLGTMRYTIWCRDELLDHSKLVAGGGLEEIVQEALTRT